MKDWRKWQYYVIIAVLSLISIFFLPLVGSEVDLELRIPNTVIGWIVYIGSKLIVAAINMLLFHCFILQGKENIKGDPGYIAARKKELNSQEKEIIPCSPREHYGKVYGKKGTIIFITTCLATVGLTQAVLTFDTISMLTYVFTVIMGIIFGFIQMNAEEKYWTEEYVEYQEMVERNNKEKGEEHERDKH